MQPRLPFRQALLAATAAVVSLMAGCSSSPVPATTATAPTPATPTPASGQSNVPEPLPGVSGATNPRDYRRDAAKHLYGKNAERIFKGKLPPLLYAVGVLQVDVDANGRVVGTRWMRAPSHAPEVIVDIERTVRLAAPFPVPAKMGRVTYTDTWLWHSSGRFQLDTLTEGQL